MEAYSVELPKGTRPQGLNLNMYTLSTPTKTTVKALTSPVRIPQFLTTAPPSSSGGAVIYDHKTMNRILQDAQLEAPVSSGSPLGDKDRRLSTKILIVIDKACLWHMLPASELVAQKLTDVIHCRHLLSTIVYGLEGCGLISSQERYDTVGGPAIPPARDVIKIAAAVTKATGFPSLLLITGSKEMKYLPTRDNLENFLSSLIPYTANFDPALAGLIREVANTHAPDLTVIQRWEDALGFAGMSLLFTILVSKCNMSLDLLNYFPKETITASNGLSILQILCAATLRYTLHTLDMYVQKFLQPDSCSTAHNLRDCLVEHETRVQQLRSLGVLGDQHLFRILEIGTLKRLCAKLSVPMLMFSEREREQGVELDRG